MKYFPKVTEIADDNWRLEDNNLVVQSLGYSLLVPQGFETDLASIPRPLWALIAPFELGLAAPIVHDWLYRHGGMIEAYASYGHEQPPFTRAAADAFLNDIMAQDGVSAWRRHAAYAGVRVGGHWSWKTLNTTTQ